MAFELFFLYDTHCPWSYRAATLVNQINSAFPDFKLHLLHAGYFDGNQIIPQKQLITVTEISGYKFSEAYTASLNMERNSILTTNLLSWAAKKSPKQSLALLKAIQTAHFEEGNPLDTLDSIQPILDQLKLFPPAKILTSKKFSKEAETALHDINELQDLIGTEAIPALLIAVGEQIILLNHNLYLLETEKIIEAITIELNKLN